MHTGKKVILNATFYDTFVILFFCRIARNFTSKRNSNLGKRFCNLFNMVGTLDFRSCCLTYILYRNINGWSFLKKGVAGNIKAQSLILSLQFSIIIVHTNYYNTRYLGNHLFRHRSSFVFRGKIGFVLGKNRVRNFSSLNRSTGPKL